MSSEEDDSSSKSSVPSKDSNYEQFEILKSKFLEILEDRFFGNLKHNWRKGEQEKQTQSLPSFESLSDESGSYLILDGKKISFDWFRQALAKTTPEREVLEVLPSHVGSIEKIDFESPYMVGTPEQMAPLLQAEDRFHTHRSRAKDGMRDRLLVEDKTFEEETTGREFKHHSKLATQFDPHYRSEISYRPRIRNFTRVDAIHKMREASRNQFETYYRKEYLFEKTEVQKAEKQYHQQLHERCAEMIQALRVVRQQRFSQSMRVMDKVKPCYEETARLEKELRDRQQQMVGLWNKVIKLESIWVRRLKYQNFMYLIMPKGWREEHDWIHMNEDGKLEGYPESISNRNVVNLRNLDGKNDIWAVKEFFEREYVEKNKPVHAAFETSQSLLEGVAELDVNSITLLNRLNMLNWTKVEAEKNTKDILNNYNKLIGNLRYSIQDLLAKKESYERRSAELKKVFHEWVKDPLRECISSEKNRNVETLLYVLYKNLLPLDQRQNALRFSGTESFTYVSNVILQLLAEFDKIPSEVIQFVEKRVRFAHMRKMKAAERAAEEDHRHKLLAIQLKRSLAPPYVKPPRKGKLPRSRLKKKPPPKPISPPKETKLDRIFKLGFGEHATLSDTERKNLEIDLVYGNFCSVRFEQYLRSIGYEPEYDFVSMVEQRDGPETKFMKRKELIPLVLSRVKRWEAYQEKLKQKLLLQQND
ncbi:uncharacterized protein LOC110679586 [Aedes aegypti]|uniref:Uncharacterized protein n=1 Tax=Aedes aegypti TaxID=7159 RepID=A0A6I8TU05_AEDAE|nr:uncharacterized protein LOC110679586 [Aedes aegypti]